MRRSIVRTSLGIIIESPIAGRYMYTGNRVCIGVSRHPYAQALETKDIKAGRARRGSGIGVQWNVGGIHDERAHDTDEGTIP